MVGKHTGIDLDCNGGTGPCGQPDSLLWDAWTECVEWSTISQEFRTGGTPRGTGPNTFRVVRTAQLDFLYLGATVFTAALYHGLGGCPIRVTLIALLLGVIELPVPVPALLTGISINRPIEITIQHHTTTPMVAEYILSNQL